MLRKQLRKDETGEIKFDHVLKLLLMLKYVPNIVGLSKSWCCGGQSLKHALLYFFDGSFALGSIEEVSIYEEAGEEEEIA